MSIIYNPLYSSAVIDNLYSQLHKHPGIGVSCLYADYKDQNNQTLVHILGSFLRQFLTTVPEPIPNEIIQKLDDIQYKGRKFETEDILALLKVRLHQLKYAFICIDAVDELDPKVRQQLLNVLKELIASNNTRVFFTGRDHVEGEIKKHFEAAEGHTVNISASQQDIREFVRQQIKEDYNLNPDSMDPVLAKSIEDAIIEKSEGM